MWYVRFGMPRAEPEGKAVERRTAAGLPPSRFRSRAVLAASTLRATAWSDEICPKRLLRWVATVLIWMSRSMENSWLRRSCNWASKVNTSVWPARMSASTSSIWASSAAMFTV